MNCSEILNKGWDWGYKQVFVKPNIPAKKLKAAINSYAHSVSENEVLVLLDDTVFGGAKEGVILTADTMHCKQKGEPAKRICFADDIKIAVGSQSRILANGQLFFKANLVAHTAILTFVYRIKNCVETPTVNTQSGTPTPTPTPTSTVAPQNKRNDPKIPKLKKILKVYSNDSVFEAMKKMNMIGHAGAIFGGSGNQKEKSNTYLIEQYRRVVYGNVTVFRKYVADKQLHEMANDLATTEVATYVLGALLKEMRSRNVDGRVVQKIVMEGMPEAFIIKDINGSVANTVIEVATQYATEQDPEIQLVLRLLCGNIEGRFVTNHNPRSYIGKTFENDSEFMESLQYLAAQLEKLLPNIHQKTNREVKIFVSNVMDVIMANKQI